MENILTDIEITKIREVLELELLKRGINTTLTVNEEQLHKYNDTQRRLTVMSEPFQTTPVLFKKIYVHSFGGGHINKIEQTPEVTNNVSYYEIWLQMNYRWETFDGGSNGTNLFDIRLRVLGDRVEIITIM